MADKKIIVEREDLTSLSSHIREKSGSETASLTWPTGFINEVDNISTGIDISGVTASAADILYDKKTFDINGDLVTGTIQQQTATNRNITAASQTETVNAGYYPSSFTVSIPNSAITGLSADNMLSTATVLGVTGNIPTVSPSKEELTTAADYVTIPLGYHPTVKTITIASSAITDLNSNNILSGKTILGVEGSIPTQSISDPVISTVSQSIPVPSGYYAFDTAISIKSEDQENLVPSNIKSGITILGVTGTADTGTIIEDTYYKSIIERTITSISDDTISSIGSFAFGRCWSLTTVNFPNCSIIGDYAFEYCYYLSSINFPACTSISMYAFENCNSLISISFPSCTSIGSNAFYSCFKLTNIDFPNCNFIGLNAFYNCSKLTSIDFPNCTTIGGYAFYKCTSLTSINFSSCITISTRAFGGTVDTPPSLTTAIWGDPIVIADFPNCITISDYAFEGCSKLTTANFPNCTTIGSAAFQYCYSLTSINFSNCITINGLAFGGYNSTTNSTSTLYQGCKIVSAIFPKCTTIGASAFYRCNQLTVADFSSCITISRYAFADCNSLSTANFPNCTTIGSAAFNNCSSLSSINFPICESIQQSAFNNCDALTIVNFPACTNLGDNAFFVCNSLTEVDFPVCTSIGNSVFYGCNSLTSTNFPLCTYIGNATFYNCTNLTTVDFPNCTTIGASAFYSCRNLKVFSFPKVSSGIYSGTFSACTSMETAYFPQILSLNSNSGFYSKAYLQNITILGRSTSTIYASTFKGCSRLTNLTILRSEGVAPLAATNAFTSTPISTYTTYTGGINGSIYVPASLVDAYKSATNWATYAARITSIPEPTP